MGHDWEHPFRPTAQEVQDPIVRQDRQVQYTALPADNIALHFLKDTVDAIADVSTSGRECRSSDVAQVIYYKRTFADLTIDALYRHVRIAHTRWLEDTMAGRESTFVQLEHGKLDRTLSVTTRFMLLQSVEGRLRGMITQYYGEQKDSHWMMFKGTDINACAPRPMTQYDVNYLRDDLVGALDAQDYFDTAITTGQLLEGYEDQER